LQHFDGPRAAREAGYGEKAADRIWTILLSHGSVKERMEYLRWQPTAQHIRPETVLSQIAQEELEDADNLFITNPFTGEMEFVPSLATPSQKRAFGFQRRTTTRGGLQTEDVTITRPARASKFPVLAKRLGLDTFDPDLVSREQDDIADIQMNVVEADRDQPYEDGKTYGAWIDEQREIVRDLATRLANEKDGAVPSADWSEEQARDEEITRDHDVDEGGDDRAASDEFEEYFKNQPWGPDHAT
jgi:hypothetical protein